MEPTHPDFKVGDYVMIVSDLRIGVVKGFSQVAYNSPYKPSIFVATRAHETYVAHHSRQLRKIGLLEQMALAAAGKLPKDAFKDWKLPDDLRAR